ncbi:hypothetical protein [Synechococcus sp. CBW1006]|uniref:hypothetical protein n=1 Tax=Synechococcus sp. CBW1006 TaxID=1353138 RepID=UPI0018CFB9AB|nr:hypothetical protein [Synechococcus sp. CBW1006]QPN66053.1 hypothetical protein H8F26_14645 [Synechococcus sp. CBW1006]
MGAWMKRPLTLTIVVLIIAGWAVVFDLLRNGFSLASACDFGFGRRHQDLQIQFLRTMFKEPLPEKIKIDAFACGGFQDFTVTSRFRLQTQDGAKLLEALTRTYSSPQNSEFVKDAEKRQSVVTFPDGKLTSFYLPGVKVVYSREIKVRFPANSTSEATIDFVGTQW